MRGFLAVLSLSCVCSISSAATVHVAVDGNDGNPGTTSSPVATISKAFQLVWDEKKPSEIVIHQGVYPGDTRVGDNKDRLGGAGSARRTRFTAATRPGFSCRTHRTSPS